MSWITLHIVKAYIFQIISVYYKKFKVKDYTTAVEFNMF